MIIYIYFINIIIIIKCFKNELNSQFRARSGPIRLDPVIRSDPVNTWTDHQTDTPALAGVRTKINSDCDQFQV